MEPKKIFDAAGLWFMTHAIKKEIVLEILQKHGIEIEGNIDGSMFYWAITSRIEIDDLCNVLNEVGFNGVLTTASDKSEGQGEF